MIYLLYGPDNFRMRTRAQQICSTLAQAYPGLSAVWLDSEKMAGEDLPAALSAQSLLSDHRLVVVQDVLSNDKDSSSAWLMNWLQQYDPASIDLVFLETAAITARSPWSKYLSQWQVEPYPVLSGQDIQAWLDQQMKERQLGITPSARHQLINDFGNDLWRLSNELDKLACFAGGQIIDTLILQQLVVSLTPDNIWQAIDALARKDFQAANTLFNHQLTVGTNETELFSMVAYQFRNIALVKASIEAGTQLDKLATKTGLHPYVVKKSLGFSKTFSWTQLQRIFYLLQKVDVAVKNNQTPPRVGLDILVAQIVSV